MSAQVAPIWLYDARVVDDRDIQGQKIKMISGQLTNAATQACQGWTSYVTAAFTIIIAAIGVWIAFRQSQIARNKLKFDLFERRMAVYEVVRTTLGKAVSTGKLSRDDEIEYLIGTRSAQWLFGSQVFDYVDKILWKRIVDFGLHNAMISQHHSEERTRHVYAHSEMMQWLVDQYRTFDDLCEPYLKLSH